MDHPTRAAAMADMIAAHLTSVASMAKQQQQQAPTVNIQAHSEKVRECTTWTCDVCQRETFDTYQDAVEHEKKCQGGATSNQLNGHKKKRRRTNTSLDTFSEHLIHEKKCTIDGDNNEKLDGALLHSVDANPTAKEKTLENHPNNTSGDEMNSLLKEVNEGTRCPLSRKVGKSGREEERKRNRNRAMAHRSHKQKGEDIRKLEEVAEELRTSLLPETRDAINANILFLWYLVHENVRKNGKHKLSCDDLTDITSKIDKLEKACGELRSSLLQKVRDSSHAQTLILWLGALKAGGDDWMDIKLKLLKFEVRMLEKKKAGDIPQGKEKTTENHVDNAAGDNHPDDPLKVNQGSLHDDAHQTDISLVSVPNENSNKCTLMPSPQQQEQQHMSFTQHSIPPAGPTLPTILNPAATSLKCPELASDHFQTVTNRSQDLSGLREYSHRNLTELLLPGPMMTINSGHVDIAKKAAEIAKSIHGTSSLPNYARPPELQNKKFTNNSKNIAQLLNHSRQSSSSGINKSNNVHLQHIQQNFKDSKCCKYEGCAAAACTGAYCSKHAGGIKLCEHEGCTTASWRTGVYCAKHFVSSKHCGHEGCTKHAKTGGYCVQHGGGKRCKHEGCTKHALSGGYCSRHGGGKQCEYEDCTKHALSGGYCVQHGGGKRCKHEGCTKHALSGGLGGYCWKHGGGKRCKHDGCTKHAQTRGYCIRHGGGKQCEYEGCTKQAKKGGCCIKHGGGKRCEHEGCTKYARAGGYCTAHGGGRRCEYEGCTKQAKKGGYCKGHQGVAKTVTI